MTTFNRIQENTENYKLVRVTFVVGKLVESVVKEKIARHIFLLKENQHGVRKGKLCFTNLL